MTKRDECIVAITITANDLAYDDTVDWYLEGVDPCVPPMTMDIGDRHSTYWDQFPSPTEAVSDFLDYINAMEQPVGLDGKDDSFGIYRED